MLRQASEGPPHTVTNGLSLQLHPDLLTTELLNRIEKIRDHLSRELGLIVPEIPLESSSSIAPGDYIIHLRGTELARGTVVVDQILAVASYEKLSEFPGPQIHEPAYGMPGKWIAEEQRGLAHQSGCMLFEPVSVMTTHLTETYRTQAGTLLSIEQVHSMLKQRGIRMLAQDLASRGLDRFVIWKVLRLLLDERVPIHNLLGILEALAQHTDTQDPAQLAEFARRGLARELCSCFAIAEKTLNVITLDPDLEHGAPASERHSEFLEAIAAEMEDSHKRGLQPILLCSPASRPYLRRLTARSFPNLAILSWEEIAPGYNVNSVGMVKLSDSTWAQRIIDQIRATEAK